MFTSFSVLATAFSMAFFADMSVGRLTVEGVGSNVVGADASPSGAVVGVGVASFSGVAVVDAEAPFTPTKVVLESCE
jgi:hypothetical protein